MIMRSGLVCGAQFMAGVRLRAGIPRSTGARVRVRRSIWASLSSAPARLILSPSTSPSQPSRSASAMRAVRLSRISARRCSLGGVGPEHGAAEAGVLVDAGGGERAAAGAGGDLAAFEVAEELLPFVVGGDAVFLAGAQRAAAGEERQVGLDGLVGVDGLVADGDVDVAVPGDDLGDVRREAVEDGVGDEHPAEVVRGEVQRAAVGGSVSPVRASAAVSMSRMVAALMARFSAPKRRWNSSGAGGSQRRSCSS